MTPQQLRNSILQLAMEGKLVEQRMEEGSGEELYQNVQKGKARFIRDGKIKERKEPLPAIKEKEKPFNIPKTWVWARFGDCTSYDQKKEKINAASITPDMWSLDLEDIKKESGVIVNFVSAKDRIIKGDKACFHKGQILYSKLRPYLKKILVAPDDGICTPELVAFNAYGNILPSFIVYFLKSPHVDLKVNSNTYGQKMPRVGSDTMVNLLLPIPPLAEQKRIVAKLDELMPLVDRYEEAWTKLEAFNARFPVDMQNSILQMAMEGKLVEQRPEEGTAEELFEQIQAEKKRLIKEGIIEEGKALPKITDKDKPFEIPKNWKWVRWGDLSKFIQYGYNAPANSTGNIRMVRISDIQDSKVLWEKVPFCDIKEDEISKYLLEKNDILFARTGGTVGKSYLVKDVPVESIFAGYLIRTQYSSLLCPEYLIHFMKSSLYWKQLRNGTTITAQPNCNAKTLSKMMLPLPPLSEQKRIVAKLEELYPLCERLKS